MTPRAAAGPGRRRSPSPAATARSGRALPELPGGAARDRVAFDAPGDVREGRCTVGGAVALLAISLPSGKVELRHIPAWPAPSACDSAAGLPRRRRRLAAHAGASSPPSLPAPVSFRNRNGETPTSSASMAAARRRCRWLRIDRITAGSLLARRPRRTVGGRPEGPSDQRLRLFHHRSRPRLNEATRTISTSISAFTANPTITGFARVERCRTGNSDCQGAADCLGDPADAVEQHRNDDGKPARTD